MPTLELVTTEELLHELVKRYSTLVVLGVHQGDLEELTEVVSGPAYAVAGLLHQMSCAVTASLTHPIDNEEL